MSFSFANGLFWLSVACCALAQFCILRSVGTSRHATSALPRQRNAMELVWAVLPAAGLAVLLMFTWRAVRARGEPAAPAAPVMSPVQRLGSAS